MAIFLNLQRVRFFPLCKRTQFRFHAKKNISVELLMLFVFLKRGSHTTWNTWFQTFVRSTSDKARYYAKSLVRVVVTSNIYTFLPDWKMANIKMRIEGYATFVLYPIRRGNMKVTFSNRISKFFLTINFKAVIILFEPFRGIMLLDGSFGICVSANRLISFYFASRRRFDFNLWHGGPTMR